MNLYVLLPDGRKSPIADEVARRFGLRPNTKTVMGFLILEDK